MKTQIGRRLLARTLGAGAAVACTASTAFAAETACATLVRATEAAAAQPRIHAAIDRAPDADAMQRGAKAVLLHTIVIDRTQYSNATRAGFSKTPLDSPEMRLVATGLAPFLAGSSCELGGAERVAGRDAQVFRSTADLGRGQARLVLWVDKASGLPVRATSDEPDVDVDVSFGRGDPKKRGVAISEKPNGKRVLATYAYLYGDAVKPPGAGGALDPAALTTLLALLKRDR